MTINMHGEDSRPWGEGQEYKNQEEHLKSSDHWKTLIDAHYATQGSKKVWNYFLEILRGDRFQKSVLRMREKFQLPVNGFRDSSEEKEWYQKNTHTSEEIRDDVQELARFYALDAFCYDRPASQDERNKYAESLYEMLDFYVFHNRLMWEPDWSMSIGNLCIVVVEEVEKDDQSCYPVSIRISPYATKNDIVDFVEKLYTKQIKPIQQKHKRKDIRLGKVKEKNTDVQKRNDFIYENKDTPRRELSKLVFEKFGQALGYAGINSIIASEKRRRSAA